MRAPKPRTHATVSPARTSNSIVRYLLSGLLAFTAVAASAADLNTLFGKMDAASAGYRTMRADVAWTSYTALVDDTSVESGKIVVRKEGDAIELKIDFTAPYPRQIRIDGTKFESYKPRIQTIEEYDLAKHKDKLEQALLIGFGVSGKTIAKNYDAKILGDEDLDGVSTVHLELIPKSAEMRESVPKLEMWISTATWQPVQQKLHSASGGDYRLYSYSNAEINPSLKASDFKLQISGKAKRIKPGS